ncbi:hypothetical protein MKJ01_17415 [Chryseobacterium sp. SSA4.19]|uniref:hypothetical protein n=1 Tax=Chryseobacterium sp. SSA4.19 TaxID=2919915 RepID=UPI001F4DF83F|nr:hypothetical protein [Chryseobacterium sp. SSA4.19]MCJ8155541.1 hypothetical protein [Chryseobacterium sp. SSA4.19]
MEEANKQQTKRNTKSVRSYGFLIIIPFLLPLFFIGRTFGWWQNEFVARGYVIGIESNGKVYELAHGGAFAFSKTYVRDKKVFLKAGTGTVCFISALAEHHYQLNSERTTNPFFQGTVTFTNSDDQSEFHCQEDRKYIDATSYYTVNNVFNRKGRLLLAYSTDDDAPKSLRKTQLIKTIINQGMSSRSGGSVSDVKDPYIDISAIFEQFFHKKITYSVDEKKKIIRLIL